jgi:hypothetical protein
MSEATNPGHGLSLEEVTKIADEVLKKKRQAAEK